jgi:hypothetical protein
MTPQDTINSKPPLVRVILHAYVTKSAREPGMSWQIAERLERDAVHWWKGILLAHEVMFGRRFDEQDIAEKLIPDLCNLDPMWGELLTGGRS